MAKSTSSLERFVRNPYLNLFVGMVLLASCACETFRDIRTMDGFRLGAHHGLLLFSL